MPAAGNSAACLEQRPNHLWYFTRWVSFRIEAGITGREVPRPVLEASLRAKTHVEAEQVHGAGIAVIDRITASVSPVFGCDALLTATANAALFIRTADCLPVFFADSSRGVVGLAHAGWRGLLAGLPARMVAAMKHYYHSQAKDIQVAVGPAIRSCCYAVGPEFERTFSRFTRQANGGYACDLIGAAVDQLRHCGIPQGNIFDAKRCTSCEKDDWFSLRREGPATGRLTSFIMLRS